MLVALHNFGFCTESKLNLEKAIAKYLNVLLSQLFISIRLIL